VTVDSGLVAGRYQLIREVGRGGMGSVWLAHDEVLGRDVALKRLGQFQGQQNQARAQREAQLAARLSHPNVVTVFDLAEEGETRWLVMEYVEGTTLSQLAAERGGLPIEEACAIVRQAAEALRVAHEAGIVHRDVKPSNLIVAPDGTTKLTDFGIARGAADDTLTSTGILTGSPAYISPEVASGGMATTASDIWSLGGSLFQAVTGRPPYEVGENVLAGLLKVVQDDPPRLPPGSGPLETVLAATMVKEPERRWTAAQVCAFLDGAPLAAGPAGPVEPAQSSPSDDTKLLPPLPPPDAIIPPPPTQAPPSAAAPPEPPDRPGRPGRSGRSAALLWPVAAGLLVLVLLLGAWLLGRAGSPDRSAERADRSATSSATVAPSTSRPSASGAVSGPTASGMATFVRDYLATVTTDTKAAFAMLTPSFQEESGGYDDYHAFWAPIRGATVSEVEADPEDLTVSYRVAYDGPESRPSEDRVQLQLVYRDGRYLISGESSRDGGDRGTGGGSQGEGGGQG
jgi:serine/threonine protein kinase